MIVARRRKGRERARNRETVLLYQWGHGLFHTDAEISALSVPSPLTEQEIQTARDHLGSPPANPADPVARIAIRSFCLAHFAGSDEYVCPDFERTRK